MKIDPNRVGLTLGISFAVYHFVWAILILLGLGGLISNQYMSMHFVRMNAVYLDFSLPRAFVGILLAFVIGYGMGYVLGYVWVRLNK